MSRIGKKPIALPKGVTVNIAPDAVEVQGPKGKMRQAIPPGIVFAQEDGNVVAQLERADDSLRKFHGLARSLVANAVLGGLGTSILTTSHGVMTGRAAKKAGVGGEVLCNIW